MFPTMLLIPTQLFPQYIKKADLDSYLQKHAKHVRFGFIFAASVCIFAVMYVVFGVVPGMYALYKTSNQTPSVVLSYLPFIVVVYVIIGLIFMVFVATSQPLNELEVQKLKQDKEEMVKISNSLVNNRLRISFVIYTGLFAVLIGGLLLSIYNLASSIH